jgi:hypothetical protein
MAIINSLAIKNGSGQMGGIVYYMLNGQQCTRTLPVIYNDLKSQAQLLQRAKISNMVMSYQLLKDFLKYTKPLCRSTESIYNMFARLVTTFMSTAVQATHKLALAFAYDNYLGSTSWCFINSVTHNPTTYTIAINTGVTVWSVGLKLRILSFNGGSDMQIIQEHVITEDEWLDGIIDFGSLGAFDNMPVCYIYNSNDVGCSNLYFHM